jgi:hypothetical protein
MGFETNPQVLRVSPGQTLWESHGQFADLNGYLENADIYEDGSVLLVPTYRLEEVEETIEPEKPGVPVEPYVGLSWEFLGEKRVIVDVSSTHYVTACQCHDEWDRLIPLEISDLGWGNYPRTPATPAVTRKVKKWVKIEHPEVPEE